MRGTRHDGEGKTPMFALLFALLLSDPAHTVQPDEILKDPVLETRARDLSQHFRCLVCQNQSIDESDAPLARDLRILIREQLTNGKSDTEVTDFVVSRYGEYVLLKPPFRASTLLLWLAPFALLLAGAGYLWSSRTAKVPETRPLSSEDEQKLAEILAREK
jgi:cytochrome c-type biogenesis protein CcmH